MKDILEIKSVAAETGTTIKDIDEKEGRISGYFAVFGNIDSDGDMIMPGAFKKTLSENYRRIKHLYQHDPWKPLAGTRDNRLTVKEDTYGLNFESTISQTTWGRDTIRLYVDGVIDEQSIGFRTIKALERENYKELTELMLFEGSTVTWAANELAQTTAVKSLFTIESLTKKMDSIIKSFRNGKYENEEIFDQLELYFKQLQQLFIDLNKKTTEPEQIVSTLPEPKGNELLVIEQFTNNLKTAANGNKRITSEARRA